MNENALCGIISRARQFAGGLACSSYLEALLSLFEDYHIMDFVNGDAAKCGCSVEMSDRLKSLAICVEEFYLALPRRLTDSEIIALPGWREVRKKAAAFLDVAADWAEQNCAKRSVAGDV